MNCILAYTFSYLLTIYLPLFICIDHFWSHSPSVVELRVVNVCTVLVNTLPIFRSLKDLNFIYESEQIPVRHDLWTLLQFLPSLLWWHSSWSFALRRHFPYYLSSPWLYQEEANWMMLGLRKRRHTFSLTPCNFCVLLLLWSQHLNFIYQIHDLFFLISLHSVFSPYCFFNFIDKIWIFENPLLSDDCFFTAVCCVVFKDLDEDRF